MISNQPDTVNKEISEMSIKISTQDSFWDIHWDVTYKPPLIFAKPLRSVSTGSV